MKEELLKHVYQHSLLTPNDLNNILEFHRKVEFEKGEFILERGQVANRYLIIQSGLMRSYIYDFNGNDVTTDFFIEKEIVIEVSSLFQRKPSKEYIQAISDCSCYQIDFNDFQELFHSIENFREWGRAWLSQSLFHFKKRSISIISESAKYRYLTLLKERPQVVSRVPLKHIASYLEVTDTSLSRIRKSIKL